MTVHADRVQVVTTTTGTGTLALGIATEGHRTFGETVGDGASVTYLLQSGDDWEIGTGTVTTGSPDTLTRVLSSSSTGNLLNLTAGTHIVSLIVAAATLDSIQSRLGKILQVVQGTTSTEVAVTTTTYTDTNLAATITPSSNTSKILVMIDQSVSVYRATGNALAGVRLLRGSTVIHDSRSNPGEPEELGFAIEGSGVTSIMFSWRYNLMILDAPNTSNAITYKTQGRPRTSSNGETVAFQESGDSVNATSRIVLMEVAG